MLHFVFVAMSWLIATLGISGAAAAAAAAVYLGPAAALGLFGRLLAGFMACTRCVVAAVFVLATVGSYWVGRHGEYARGHHAALAEIAEENQAAIARATELRGAWRDCRSRNGQWDQSTGSCQ